MWDAASNGAFFEQVANSALDSLVYTQSDDIVQGYTY
jgi:hypothetical protein